MLESMLDLMRFTLVVRPVAPQQADLLSDVFYGGL